MRSIAKDAREEAVHEGFTAWETAAGDADTGFNGHDYKGGCAVPWDVVLAYVMMKITKRGWRKRV